MPLHRGLSELTATLLLVVVTLVAGLVLYVYLSGQTPSTPSAASEAASVVNSVGGNPATQFYASPLVSASVISCIDSDGACTIQLTNTGSSSPDATGCILGGTSGNLSPSPAQVTAGGTTQVTCTAASGHGDGVGTMVTGTIELSDGAPVEWTGTWQ